MKTKLKNYKCNITFYYKATDYNDAYKVADGIANYVEETYEITSQLDSGKVEVQEIEARVGRPLQNNN